jgi:LuxR family maltose regulon positive regulatory protein
MVVAAPAGFGKTVLLADWIGQEGRPAAWLSLDPADNDPARFWRHVAAALDQVRPGIARRLIPMLGPPAPRDFTGLVAALINELAAQPADDEIVAVLDDYHLIGSEPVHRSLAFLLEHRPPGLCVVLATRSDPPLPLARLRARGELTELRAAQLRFTVGEAAALLRHATENRLSPAAVAALTNRTEGWAAGLHLAALSLRGHPDAASFVAAFSGSHRFILDYLAEEVLDQQPQHARAFLLETSVLDRLSGGLCEAVTGRADSQAMLEELERGGLFLTPLDDTRAWWRYHQLFADLLGARLRREQPGKLPGLHRGAGAWCESHGLVDEAIRHAFAAGDAGWAARLIERHFDLQLRRGATVDQWMTGLQEDLLRSRPRLRLIQAVSALMAGRVDEAGPLLTSAERALEAGGDEPIEPSIGQAASRVANVPASVALVHAELARRHGDAAGMNAFARQARSRLSDGDDALRLQVDWYLAVADWMRGRLVEAEGALTEVFGGQQAAGERYLAVRAACDLGEVRQAQGHLDAALGGYEQALQIATEAGRLLPPAGMPLLGIAEVLYEQDDLDTAAQRAAEGIALCRQLAYAQPLATGLAISARIRQAQGDLTGALETMAEAGQVAASLGAASLLNPVPAQQARLLLAHGDVRAVARWVDERGVSADDEPSYAAEAEHLVLARLLLARQRPGEALAMLSRWHAAAVSADRTGSIVQLGVMLSLAQAANGDAGRGLESLAAALSLACPRGYVRVFADEGAPLAALAERLAVALQARPDASSGLPRDCLAPVLAALRRGPVAPPVPAATRAGARGLIEPLTARELEVLRLLAAGKSNQRIAGDLVVTLDTVKKHVSHILAKLGAANRAEAVARAHKLGLVP